MARRGELRHVELDEHDDGHGTPPPRRPGDGDSGGGTGGDTAPDHEGDAPSGRRGAPRAVLVVGAAVAVVLLVLGGVQVALDRREAAVDDRIAALRGASVDVGTELTALWELDATRPWYPMLVDGTVATGPTLIDGAHGLLARDLRTGEEVWSVPIGPPVASPDGGWGGSITCAPPPVGTSDPNHVPEVLVCHTTDAEVGSEAAPTAASWARVVVVDLRTHTVRSSVEVPRTPHAAVLDGVVALGLLDGERHVAVVGVDTATGAERWRYRAPDALPEYADDSGWISLHAAGGHVVVFDTSGRDYALDSDGVRVDGLRTDATGFNGAWLAVPARDGRSRVLRPREPDLEVAGTLARRTLDDGSAPGLEVSSSGALAWGWDATTGEQRWETAVDLSSSVGAQTVVVAEGRVHSTSSAGVRTLDARTGALLWSYDLPSGTVRSGVLCDGPHVMVLRGSEDAATVDSLVVLDRRTGDLVRELPLPPGVEWTSQLGPYVLAAAAGSATLLG